jgi:hypothetical protein
MTKEAVSPIPTIRMSRAFICSLLSRLSAFTGNAFLVILLL